MTNEDLINIAKNAKKNSYAKITNYEVGAAVLTKNAAVYIGTNIEDESIPNLSICAERVAIQNAISHADREIVKIAIVGGKPGTVDGTITPCGICLQYMLQMCRDVDIITYINGEVKSVKIDNLLNMPYELKK